MNKLSDKNEQKLLKTRKLDRNCNKNTTEKVKKFRKNNDFMSDCSLDTINKSTEKQSQKVQFSFSFFLNEINTLHSNANRFSSEYRTICIRKTIQNRK